MQRTTSRRTEMRPSRPRAGWIWLIALCCALSGCAGGSGSSGFDVLAENIAIEMALDTDQCEVFEGLTICPAASPAPAPTETAVAPAATPSETPTPSATDTPSQGNLTQTPTDEGTVTPTGTPVMGTPTLTTTIPAPSPTPTDMRTATPAPTATAPPDSPSPTATDIPSRPNVETNFSSSDELPCLPDTPSTCTLVFVFQPVGLPSSASYWVAVRNRNPDGEWVVVEAPNNRASVAVSTEIAQQYQFAVLVFLTDPSFVPETVDLLADTGADFAYVTPALTPAEI